LKFTSTPAVSELNYNLMLNILFDLVQVIACKLDDTGMQLDTPIFNICEGKVTTSTLPLV